MRAPCGRRRRIGVVRRWRQAGVGWAWPVGVRRWLRRRATVRERQSTGPGWPEPRVAAPWRVTHGGVLCRVGIRVAPLPRARASTARVPVARALLGRDAACAAVRFREWRAALPRCARVRRSRTSRVSRSRRRWASVAALPAATGRVSRLPGRGEWWLRRASARWVARPKGGA